MINNIKKVSLLCLMVFGIFTASFNTGFAAFKSKKSEVTKLEDIDWNEFDITVLDKNEINTIYCNMGKKGISLSSLDGNYELKVFFNQPLEIASKWSKTSIFLPNERIVAAELADLDGKFEFVDKFSNSNLFHTVNERNYVLVNSDCTYRVDIDTDRDGNITYLTIVNFKSEDGVYNYLKLRKYLAEKSNGLA